MENQTRCLFYLFIVIIFSTTMVMIVFKKVKPQAYANVRNNENSWLVAIIIILILINEIGKVVLEWCDP